MDMGALPGLGLCVEPVRYCSSSSPILLRLPLHRRCFWVLILQPVAGATSAISRTQALGDDALQPHLAGMLEHDVDGPPQRIRDKGQQHLPGDEAWLIGEHRPSGEKKYYLANLPAKTGLRMLAAIIKARWICEQAHQQLKEELGLEHFEGRSWQGLHRHALMTMIALRLPSASSPHPSEAGKKESTDHHLSQACQPCATLSSISSCDRFSAARTADDGSGRDCGVN